MSTTVDARANREGFAVFQSRGFGMVAARAAVRLLRRRLIVLLDVATHGRGDAGGQSKPCILSRLPSS
ncbi:hypothetical protein [Agromyces sp. Soil535]|uniref:hypothetical protein n=1 Tax=Agromyces sp. Soil535 TaxID=1736390 RepID=UPI0006F3829F|nr:hypothetical protein [Agromyces sp. Soil535]KRE22942.1 hypothetical protein ASG80_08695 [Agromyces sp. Soil535]